MNLAEVSVVASIVGVILAVYVAVRTQRKEARALAASEAKEKQDIYNRGMVDGRTSRDDEVRQLTFERDDARRERDDAARRADSYESRYNDLRDRGGDR